MKTSKITLPSLYRASVLSEAGAPLSLVEKPLGELARNEVWVQIKAAPVNPSDLAMLAGTYPHQKTYPFTPGLEGAGIVVASGGGFLANYLLGKRVACSPQESGDGTWAEYMKTDAAKCVPLTEKLSFAQGAAALVNPLTALVLIKKVQGRSFVNTAAAGALGKMLISLAHKHKLTAINVVRNPEQVAALKQTGADIVLDSSSPNFNEAYRAACNKHNATTIFDAVGGTFTNQLLLGAPKHSKLIAYASLSQEPISIAPQQIIMFNKRIEGFHLGTWLQGQGMLTKLALTRRAQKLIAEGTLSTHVNREFSLNEIKEAVAAYQQKMSLGKWLLVP